MWPCNNMCSEAAIIFLKPTPTPNLLALRGMFWKYRGLLLLFLQPPAELPRTQRPSLTDTVQLVLSSHCKVSGVRLHISSFVKFFLNSSKAILEVEQTKGSSLEFDMMKMETTLPFFLSLQPVWLRVQIWFELEANMLMKRTNIIHSFVQCKVMILIYIFITCKKCVCVCLLRLQSINGKRLECEKLWFYSPELTLLYSLLF